MKTVFIPKGEYLFKQNDSSDKFYGIISGTISLRAFKTPFTTNDLEKTIVSSLEEKELFKLKIGDCFGEWGLMYNKGRSASALAVEDTILFYLNANYFRYFFSVSI